MAYTVKKELAYYSFAKFSLGETRENEDSSTNLFGEKEALQILQNSYTYDR